MTKEQRNKEYKEITASMKEIQQKIKRLDIEKNRNEVLKLAHEQKALLDKLTKLVMVKLRVDLKEDILKNVY